MPDPLKTGWDKAAIVLQPLGGLLTALAVAFVGFLGSRYLDRSQSQDAKLRLYTELMSRREESDTTLREDMFKSIVGTFMTRSTAPLEQKVLSLELLAYNFHESLELGPLFNHVRREVQASQDPHKAQFAKRLVKVAREVAEKQIEVLQGNGALAERGIDLDDLKAQPAGITVLDKCFPLYAQDAARLAARNQSAAPAAPDANPRCVRATVMDADPEMKALRVRLESTTPEGESLGRIFSVDFYNFPMVDNMRLSHDQRFAVVLEQFGDTSAQLGFVYFPGSHAGLKDKPFYDDMLRQLQISPGPGDSSGPR